MSDDPMPAPEMAVEPVIPVVSGAQTILSGAAQAAARGETHGDMLSNMVARDKALMPDEPAENQV